jgi:hypothetical protein
MLRVLIVPLILLSFACAQVVHHSVIVSLSGGYACFSADDLNAALSRLKYAEIKGSFTGGVDIGYFLIPKVSVHLAGGYLQGTSKGNSINVTGPGGPEVLARPEETYSITSIPLAFGVEYQAIAQKFGVAVGAFAEIYPTTIKYHLDGTPYSQSVDESRSETGIGARISIFPSYSLTETLALKAELGYRLASTSDFSSQQGFLPAKLNLILSGLCIMAGVMLRF